MFVVVTNAKLRKDLNIIIKMSLSTVIVLCILMVSGCRAEYNNSMTRSYKGFHCMENIDCHTPFDVKRLCIANECQCLVHHHINNNDICVRDRGLKEICLSSDECYWGPEMVDKIECSLGVCSCVAGYVPDHGKICVKYFSAGTTAVKILPLLTVMIIVYIIKIF